MQSTFYEILGLKITASDEEIRASYKTLAKKYHPDLHNGEKFYEEHFKKINEAYQVLSDTQKRARYDQKLRYGNTATTTNTNTHRPRPTTAPPRPQRKKEAPVDNTKSKNPKRMYIITALVFIAFVAGVMTFYFHMNKVSSYQYLKEGEAFEQQKKYATAYEAYSMAIDLYDKNSEAYYHRAHLAKTLLDNCQRALYDYAKAIETAETPSYEMYYEKSLCHMQNSENDEALYCLTKALELKPNDDSIFMKLGDLMFLKGQYKEAVINYSLFLEENPTHVITFMKRGHCYQLINELDKGLEDLDKAISLDSAMGDAYYMRAQIKFGLGEGKSADEDLRIAATKNSKRAIRMLNEKGKKDSLDIEVEGF